MGRRRHKKRSEFNPFIDILTCLAGVMILIIILVVIEAKESKIMIPTPMMHDATRQPFYIEVDRQGHFYPIPLDELNNLVQVKLAEAAAEAGGNQLKMLSLLGSMDVRTDNYKIDMSYAMMQNLVITPTPEAKGLDLGLKTSAFGTADWFNDLLDGLNKDTHMVVFIVRSADESYRAFKKARAIAWLQNTDVAYEVIDNREPLKFGFGGIMPSPQ